MSNVHRLLPKLALNRRFAQDLLGADAPCCGIGVVEEQRQLYALPALRLGVTLPDEDRHVGQIAERGFLPMAGRAADDQEAHAGDGHVAAVEHNAIIGAVLDMGRCQRDS